MIIDSIPVHSIKMLDLQMLLHSLQERLYGLAIAERLADLIPCQVEMVDHQKKQVTFRFLRLIIRRTCFNIFCWQPVQTCQYQLKPDCLREKGTLPALRYTITLQSSDEEDNSYILNTKKPQFTWFLMHIPTLCVAFGTFLLCYSRCIFPNEI